MVPRHPRNTAGFTLVEAMTGLVLMGLLVSGAMSLFVSSTRSVAQAYARTDAAAKGANGLQATLSAIREASAAALPGEAAFSPNNTYNGAAFTTTVGGQTISTAALLTYPGASSTVTVFYQGQSRAVTPAPYDRSLPGTTSLLIYRADFGKSGVADGTPNASAGRFLAQSSGTLSSATKICTLSDTDAVAAATPNAVQFLRTGPNQIEIRLIVNNYSPNASQQSSESTQTLLTGKCVLLRNHS